ncbi:MAG: bifunctional (p)ppGpp synthetase/guanosine-3',5'-bis(diphosphate) 3'-pyrophosphohydrolase [Eubacterium sp.]|nr:bifunctional (p)ppGpp synthetase/guanosine-3',5'-bis(diphosphate) 3'-pyrophosphohydrolase [Eubacterium sp.]
MFEKAVAFAMKAHEGQRRKDGGVYILHPLEDATIVGTMTDDLELLAAAVLHDTVEDTDTTLEEIEENFGPRVAELVSHETENKRPHLDPKDTWEIRKKESLEVLKNSPIESKMLWVGDKLSNMRSLTRGYDAIGELVFQRFNVTDPRKQCWYHGKVLEYTKELSHYPAYKEYKTLYKMVFSDYIQEED